MQKRKLNSQGFAHIAVVLTMVVLAGVAGAGAYVYHRQHTKKTSTTSSSTQLSSNTNHGTTPTPTPDPYEGWKTYCDTTYHYCFKYPASGWKLDANSAAAVNSTAQTTLSNDANTVSMSYINAFVRDGGLLDLTPTYIGTLSSANKELSIVGGYSATGGGVAGNYDARYMVMDTSLLTTYPLIIGKTAQFLNNPRFTDKISNSSSDQGSFVAMPATSIDTITDAAAWLNSDDAKTSLKILQSLYYQQ